MWITREDLALRPLTLEKTYPPESFQSISEDFRVETPVRIEGAAELRGSDIRVHGAVGTAVTARCDRCTRAVEFPLEQRFDLLYRPAASIARQEEIEVPRDELDVGFYTGEDINLADLVKEQIILALPMKVICRPDCRGLCPVCGADLNNGACRCQEPRKESPFGALLDNSAR